MNQYQSLCAVKKLTGYQIRLGLMEEICAFRSTPDRITVQISRAKVKSSRMGLEVTRRGVTVFEWAHTDSGWKMLEPVEVWWSTSELHTSAPSKKADPEWEELCYRPGTARNPMDNTDRRKQGY